MGYELLATQLGVSIDSNQKEKNLKLNIYRLKPTKSVIWVCGKGNETAKIDFGQSDCQSLVSNNPKIDPSSVKSLYNTSKQVILDKEEWTLDSRSQLKKLANGHGELIYESLVENTEHGYLMFLQLEAIRTDYARVFAGDTLYTNLKYQNSLNDYSLQMDVIQMSLKIIDIFQARECSNLEHSIALAKIVKVYMMISGDSLKDIFDSEGFQLFIKHVGFNSIYSFSFEELEGLLAQEKKLRQLANLVSSHEEVFNDWDEIVKSDLLQALLLGCNDNIVLQNKVLDNWKVIKDDLELQKLYVDHYGEYKGFYNSSGLTHYAYEVVNRTTHATREMIYAGGHGLSQLGSSIWQRVPSIRGGQLFYRYDNLDQSEQHLLSENINDTIEDYKDFEIK
ncbi:hypothetical protein L3V86_05140 [Thiotrichales bacterium 19S11-10]|nr:hypothetical protein [Thiotrichales bacterium 19S11-10]